MRGAKAVSIGLACLIGAATAPACGKRDTPTAARIADPPAQPPPRPLAACDQYVAALGKSAALDVDPEVRDLLRDEAGLIRAATRAPRDADRGELTMRCATGLLDLGRVPTGDSYADASGGVVGGVVGGIAAAPPPPPPPSGTSATSGPVCRALFAVLDRLTSCYGMPDALREQYRQASDMMRNAWDRMPPDQDTRDLIERACGTAADAYAQILAHYHCP